MNIVYGNKQYINLQKIEKDMYKYILVPKGSTINDLGGGGGKIEHGFIFSAGMPLRFIFSWRRASKNFFLAFLQVPPRSLMVVP